MSITEGTQPAAKTWTGNWNTAQTTASFTPEAGALLVALLSADGDGNVGATTGAITDSLGGTWTLLKRQNAFRSTMGGTAEVWCRDSPGAALTVSATGTPGTFPGGQLVVRTLIGAAAAASQNGATAGASPTAAAVQVSVTAGTGNMIYGAAFDYDTSASMTVLANTVNIANFADTTNGDNWASFKSSGDTAGTATYGYSTSANAMIAAVEIKAGAAAAAGGPLPAMPGRTWLRRFRHRQTIPPAPAAVVAAAPVPPPPIRPVQARPAAVRGGTVSRRTGVYGGVGPPVKPRSGPVRAQPAAVRGGTVESRGGLFGGVGPALRAAVGPVSARLRVLPPRGRVGSLRGVYGDVGPAVEPAHGPVQPARTFPPRGGRVAWRAGTFTSTVPVTGPPVYPTGHPVQARQLPQRPGTAVSRDGAYAGTGPAVKPLDGPVRAQPAATRGGRVVARVGTLTSGAPQAGPTIYPTGRPVTARRLPTRGGTVTRRAGVFGGVGPPPVQLRQPIGRGRLQPPPPTRGRTASLRGPSQGSGPPLRALQRPVRSRLPGPVRFGRARTTLLPPVAAPPPAFSIGVLTAGTFAPGTSAADYAPSSGPTTYAPGGAPTTYAPQSSATDTRTGGPT